MYSQVSKTQQGKEAEATIQGPSQAKGKTRTECTHCTLKLWKTQN
jgi:hypothetical protein